MTEDGRLVRHTVYYDYERHGWEIKYNEHCYPSYVNFYWHGMPHGISLVYRHVDRYWEVLNVINYYFNKQTGPTLWIHNEDGMTLES